MDGGGIYSGGASVSHDGAVVGAQEGGFAPRGGDPGFYALGECEASTVAAVGHLVGEGLGVACGAEGSPVPKVVVVAVVFPTAVDASGKPVVEVERSVASQASAQGYRTRPCGVVCLYS